MEIFIWAWNPRENKGLTIIMNNWILALSWNGNWKIKQYLCIEKQASINILLKLSVVRMLFFTFGFVSFYMWAARLLELLSCFLTGTKNKYIHVILVYINHLISIYFDILCKLPSWFFWFHSKYIDLYFPLTIICLLGVCLFDVCVQREPFLTLSGAF